MRRFFAWFSSSLWLCGVAFLPAQAQTSDCVQRGDCVGRYPPPNWGCPVGQSCDAEASRRPAPAPERRVERRHEPRETPDWGCLVERRPCATRRDDGCSGAACGETARAPRERRREAPRAPYRTVDRRPYRDGDTVVHEHHHYYRGPEICGFSCWMRRVKRGYCGSGCGYYEDRMTK